MAQACRACNMEVALDVELEDATSGEPLLLRVQPATETARQGIAWSFGVRREEYVLAVEP